MLGSSSKHVLFLTISIVLHLGISNGTDNSCTDMMSLGPATTVYHSTAKTAGGDIKTGMVAMETMLKNDTNVYFFYYKYTCKIGNEYKFNCLGLKTFTSYSNMRSMNNKTCWDKEINILAPCRLPTIRVINGFIYCELEPERNKPSLAKIDLKSGRIVKTRNLTEAKSTTNCLRTENRFWKPLCYGNINDFTVHLLVDETGLYILYRSSSHSYAVMSKINMTDLTSISTQTISYLDMNLRLILICGKLYLLPVMADSRNLTLTKAFDLNNSQNTFNYNITLVEHLPNDPNSWLYYNPAREEILIGWPNRDSIKFKVEKCYIPFPQSTTIDFSKINSTFIWSLVPGTLEQKAEMVENLDYYFKLTDFQSLKYVSSLLIRCPPRVCNDITYQKDEYCRIKSLIFSLKMYSDYRNPTIPSRKRIQVYFSMVKLLEQQNFKSISSKLNGLQGFMNKNFLELKNQLNSFRSDIGTYFTSLAQFDQSISKSDVNLIYKTLGDFKTEAEKIRKPLEGKINTLFQGAIASVTADVGMKAGYVATAALALGNPFEMLTDGVEAVLELSKAFDALAKAFVGSEKLSNLETYLPKMKEYMVNFSTVMAQNAENHSNFMRLVDLGFNQSLTDRELTENANSFLHDYDNYAPGYKKSQITGYSALLEGLVDKLCDVLFEGDTSVSAIVQAEFANRGDCFAIKLDVKSLIALYEDMYDHQDDLLDAMASAVRATVANQNAIGIKTIEHAITANQFQMNQFNIKLYTLEIFVNSQVHRLLLVHEACDVIEYKNGGVMPGHCVSAVRNLQGVSYDNVIASRFESDMCSADKLQKRVRIPATVVSLNDTVQDGIIDLTKLYSGKSVFFQIPDKNWLVENDWAYGSDINKMLVLKRLQIYLPFLQNVNNSASPVEVHTTMTVTGQNRIIPGGTEYDFNVPTKYTFRYSQNKPGCSQRLNSDIPYSLPGCPSFPSLCIISPGTVDSAVAYPSVYAKWQLSTSIHGNLRQPQIKDKFYLEADVTICVIDPVSVHRSSAKRVNFNRSRTSRGSSSCCWNQHKFYDVVSNACKSCSHGTSPDLYGYYCEKH